MKARQYVIRGGADGRERLRLLSEVMGPATRELLSTVGIPPGADCLDIGCGGATFPASWHARRARTLGWSESTSMKPNSNWRGGFDDIQLTMFHPVALVGGIKELSCSKR